MHSVLAPSPSVLHLKIFSKNLLSVLILLGEPFRIGDDIIVEGLEGTVEDIQIRATFLRSYDGRRLVIPNATVYTSPITVNTAYNRRRCEFVVGIGYDDDIDKAKAIINRILENNANVLGNPAYSDQNFTGRLLGQPRALVD